MKVRDFMSQGVQTVRPGDTLSVAAGTMWDNDCGCVPVIDQEARVLGMLTDRDICMSALMQGRPLADIPVALAMSRQVHSCHPDDSIADASRILRAQQVRRLPVTDDDGKLVGLLSINDIAIEAGRIDAPKAGGVAAEEVGLTVAAISAHRALQPVKPS